MVGHELELEAQALVLVVGRPMPGYEAVGIEIGLELERRRRLGLVGCGSWYVWRVDLHEYLRMLVFDRLLVHDRLGQASESVIRPLAFAPVLPSESEPSEPVPSPELSLSPSLSPSPFSPSQSSLPLLSSPFPPLPRLFLFQPELQLGPLEVALQSSL